MVWYVELHTYHRENCLGGFIPPHFPVLSSHRTLYMGYLSYLCPKSPGTGSPLVVLTRVSKRDGTVQISGTKGQKFLDCPGTKGQRDKLKILLRDGTGRDSLNLGRDGPVQPISGTGHGTKQDRAEKDVLKQKNDVLKQENDVLKQKTLFQNRTRMF